MPNKLPDGFVVTEELDNSEWANKIREGRKKGGKTFIMLDKNKSPEENLKAIKKATQGK